MQGSHEFLNAPDQLSRSRLLITSLKRQLFYDQRGAADRRRVMAQYTIADLEAWPGKPLQNNKQSTW